MNGQHRWHPDGTGPRRPRQHLGWRTIRRLWHVPTDPRLDFCTCGRSWPCPRADRMRWPF